MKPLRLLLLILVVGARAQAQTSEPSLNFAFSQLKGNGTLAFANILYGIDSDNAAQLVNQLNPLLKQSGDYFGYQIVTRNFLTKRVERLIIAIYFEKLPIYMRIDLYDTPRGKVFLPANVSKDAAAILPFDVISASGK